MNCLIIAAHPDDEILGCGGIVSKYKNEVDFYVLILTDGAENRYDNAMQAKLRSYACSANQIVGVRKVFFENLPNQKLDEIPILQITQIIEKYIEQIRPKTVFTHHGGDLNKDHRMVYEATMTASRPLAGQIVRKIYSYNVPSSTEWNFVEGEQVFVPNTYVDIGEFISNKIEALKNYTSECCAYPHPRSAKAIETYANYWGLTVGCEYAEPFKLVRNISSAI
jgi:LmbE family N-acetylglucosaminyl deacetylase